MHLSLHTLFVLLATYKYAVIFPIAVVGGPFISILAGALAVKGYLHLTLAFVTIVLGDLVGDALYYAIGRFGAHRHILTWIQRSPARLARFHMVERTFKSHGVELLFAAKLQGLGIIVLLAAGMTEFSFTRYMLYNAVAAMLKTFALILLGYTFYRELNKVHTFIFEIGTAFSVVFLLFVGGYLYTLFRKTR